MMQDWIGFLRSFTSVWSETTLVLVWSSVALTLYFSIVAGLGYWVRRLGPGHRVNSEMLFFLMPLSVAWPLPVFAAPVLITFATVIGIGYLIWRTARKMADDLSNHS